MASCHFHTFLCNMGSFCVSITWGLACTLRRPFLFDPSFSLYLHTPRGSRHRRDSHCFLSSKYPPIDCTNISLREASKTAPQRKSLLSFFEDGWAIVPAGNIFGLSTSRFWEVICLSVHSKNVPGKLDLWKERGSSMAVPMKLDLWRERGCSLWMLCLNFLGTWPWSFDAACCAAGKAYHWEGCI